MRALQTCLNIRLLLSFFLFLFFFNDTATTEIYTLSLHDALPISKWNFSTANSWGPIPKAYLRSEEHTSELQSRVDLVCRLLLEKKKKASRSPHYVRINTPTRTAAKSGSYY